MKEYREYVGLKVKHYKGGIYKIITHATLEENKSLLVIYQDSVGEIWARPFHIFWGQVPIENKLVQRFTLLEE